MGLLLTPAWQLALASALFLAGTEIRVRVEDALLDARFGGEFRAYRAAVAAYLPLLR
jgi:protein-S-isoprenylcysteine O-methyltransferase Ste14